MKRLWLLLLLLVAAAPARLPPDELVTTMLGRLGRAAGCPASKRAWCIAAGGWGGGTAPDLPAGERVYPGVSIGLERAKPDGELLEAEVSLAALALRDGKGLITDVPPQNAAEKKVVGEAIASVGKVLRGEAQHPALAPSLGRYLATLPATASYPLAREGGSWRMRGKADARLRKIGPVWVAIELPGEGPEGLFVSLFVEP